MLRPVSPYPIKKMPSNAVLYSHFDQPHLCMPLPDPKELEEAEKSARSESVAKDHSPQGNGKPAVLFTTTCEARQRCAAHIFFFLLMEKNVMFITRYLG